MLRDQNGASLDSGKGIISAPIMRMKNGARPNPHLQDGIPEKWAQSAKYWYENGTRCSRLRRADYYFVLAVRRWLAAKHPTITAPEQWDRNLAVLCLAMITNMRCGDWRATEQGRSRAHYGRPLKPATKMQNYTAVRTFFCGLAGMGRYPAKVRPLPQFHSAAFGQSSYRLRFPELRQPQAQSDDLLRRRTTRKSE